MALTPGTRLGVYDVLAAIGEGGMGQVWRARDTKLNREVALKVLPDSFANDPERLARFTREAQTLAALNHPHIAAIYGLEESHGVRALVMELVEGDDLSQRIARGLASPKPGGEGGAIPLDEALPIATQIAEALEAAHEQGIIHRDLKPANIKVRADGTVKVLDFGLSKALDPATASSPEAMNSPTITSPAMTQAGVILGTAAYMSPEQARGKPVDKRADIWAFGCVLFEMLTGTRLFAGDSVPETLGLIFSREPDLTMLPAGTPARVRTLIARCLMKDPRQRVRDMGDVRLALDGAFETAVPQSITPAPAARSRARVVAAVAVSGLLGALVAVAALWSRPAARTPAPEATARVSVMVPANRPISISGSPTRSLALSPDGTQLVYVGANADGPADPQGRRTQLLVRSLGTLAVRDLPGTAGARQPFFSPDGQWVGFFTQTGELRKIALAGGTPVTLVEQINGSGSSFGVWTAEGAIAFGTPTTALRLVSAEGGAVTDLTSLDVANREVSHSFPVLTPSGRTVLFVVRTGSGGVGFRTEAVMLDTGARRQVVENARPLLVLSSGHLAFERDGVVLVAPFDLDGLAVTGPAVPLVDAVRRSATIVTAFPTAELAASKSGTLAYVPAVDEASALGLVGPEGTFETLGPPPGDVSRPRVSPDGHAIAFLAARGQDLDVQVFDRRRGSTTRVTQDEVAFGVAWHPDGRSLAVAHSTKNGFGIFLKPLDGRERLLAAAPPGAFIRSLAWSPDGSKLAYTVQTGFIHDIWMLTMGDPPTTTPFLGRPASEHSPAFSPDGRWLAYVSDESGRYEVYLQPYPTGERLAVSTGGGSGPVWRRDGKALFYQGLDAGVPKMMAVAVAPDGASLSLGRPKALFDQRLPGGSGATEQYVQSTNTAVAYDVLPDGRFVMVRGADPSGSREFVLVQHWFEELKRLVPVP